MATAKQVVELAKKEIGYHEKASNSQLDDKKANPGSGSDNWNKYARNLDAVNFFNTDKNSYEWCTSFNADMHLEANNKDAKKTRAELYMPENNAYNYGAGCTQAMGYYKDAGAWIEGGNTPKVGDQIFFDWDLSGDADHTGIVVDIKNGRVYTIEGNSSDEVTARDYSITDYRIKGYGRPKYDNADSTPVTPKTPSTPASTDTTTDRVLYNGCVGDDVKDMQTKLIKCGYSCGSWGADGNFGNATEDALKKFQKAYKLEVDGCYGPESKKKLEEVYKKKSGSSSNKSNSYKVKVTHPYGLNLRQSAPSGSILTAMPQGTVLSITDTKNGWGKTTYSGITGWCCLEYTAKV